MEESDDILVAQQRWLILSWCIQVGDHGSGSQLKVILTLSVSLGEGETSSMIELIWSRVQIEIKVT